MDKADDDDWPDISTPYDDARWKFKSSNLFPDLILPPYPTLHAVLLIPRLHFSPTSSIPKLNMKYSMSSLSAFY